jgi:ectoine hydroxylase-related dioxygenase (phytanoyl-CoA dioxygenase family)
MNDESMAGYIERFRDDGFVHVPGLLTGREIAKLGSAVDQAVADRKRRDTRTLDQKTPYEQSFIQCQYLWEDCPDVRPLTFHPHITRLAAALIDAERIRLWHDQALYKEPGGRETEAHQDHPYWPIAERDTLTAWIPLQAVDDRIGCMGYVPGSHTGEAEFVDIFRSPGAGKSLEQKQTRPAVFVPCEAGDVIFHHGCTVHRAKPNTSGRTRRVYTAIYFRDGCTRTGERPHPSVDRDGILPGAPIDGAATPVAWPLADGHMPQPQPWPQTGSKVRKRYEQLGIIPESRG